MSYCRGKILYHISCRWQPSPGQAFNIEYKLLLLLWGELLLVVILGCLRGLTAPVSSTQRAPLHIEEISISLVYKFISWLARFDLCNCFVKRVHIGGVIACRARWLVALFSVRRTPRECGRLAHEHGTVRLQQHESLCCKLHMWCNPAPRKPYPNLGSFFGTGTYLYPASEI
jgi:hypothetical protein